jgi:hypothetical protein
MRSVIDVTVAGRADGTQDTILSSRPIVLDRSIDVNPLTGTSHTVCVCQGGSISVPNWTQQFGTYIDAGISRPFELRHIGFFGFHSVPSNWFTCGGQPRWCNQRGTDRWNTSIGSWSSQALNTSWPGGTRLATRKAWWAEAGDSAAVSWSNVTGGGVLTGTASTIGAETQRGDCPCDHTETTTLALQWDWTTAWGTGRFTIAGTITTSAVWYCTGACGGGASPTGGPTVDWEAPCGCDEGGQG